MRHHISAAIVNYCPRLARVLFIYLLMSAGVSQAQPSMTITDGHTPPGVEPGAPAGSYALSNFENINLFNGRLNFRLPLMRVGERGAAGYTMTLPVENNWTILRSFDNGTPYDEAVYRLLNTVDSNDVGYGPGILIGRTAASGDFESSSCNPVRYLYLLTRLTFISPDGTEYQFHDQDYQGTVAEVNMCANPITTRNRGRIFITADGGSATFISDYDIYDNVLPYRQDLFNLTGNLMMKDGTLYRIVDSKVSYIRDRNGNKVSFTYEPNSWRVSTITDSLNRLITISYAIQINSYDTISFRGFGGAIREIKVWHTALQQALRSGSSIQKLNQLFPDVYYPGGPLSGDYDHNPSVVSKVELPDQRTYEIYYNSFGELARVVLPTGGGYDYEYPPPGNSVQILMVYRRLLKRTVYNTLTPTTDPANPPTEAVEGRDIYSEGAGGASPNSISVTVEHRDSGNTLVAQEKHYYYGTPTDEASICDATAYSAWYAGREFKTEAFNVSNGVPGSALRREQHTWYPSPPGIPTYCGNGSPAPNPRIIETTTSLLDTNQIAKQTFAHDQYNNVTDVWEYDYGSGAPPTYATRHTYIDYLTTNPVNGANYATNTNIHIRNLPLQEIVYAVDPTNGAETWISQIKYEYDRYDGATNHAALVNRSNISGLDGSYTTGYTTRGNATQTDRWLNSSGSSVVSTWTQYDIAGNVVKTIDARTPAGITTFEFNDRFGSPSGEARANDPLSAPGATWLNGQTTYAFPTKVTNALGQTSYTQFDYYLGRPVDSEDTNGVVSSVSYIDLLDRLTQVIRANTLSPADTNKNQTTFTYTDAIRLITTTSDRDSFGDNLLKSEIVYDGLGRTVEARTYAPGPVGCTSPCYSLIKTTFDAMGRSYQVSNPYWKHETPIWMTTQYDALSRMVSAATPDGATVSTAYNGNETTITDQAGKTRRSQTDALGRLTMVTEDPGGLNYDTFYLYDALGNLRYVSQGAQGRWFSYDSLSRLIRVRNLEQDINPSLPPHTDPLTGGNGWSIAYSYDGNGNLTSKTDARNITTTINYDALNRPTSKTYTDGTPAVNYFYDAQALPVGAPSFDRGKSTGRLVGVTYGGGSLGNYYGYDSLGRVLLKFQRTGTTNYQIQATYNKAGAMTGETYPSGRTVTYAYNTAGQLSGFSGTLGDGLSRTYASVAQYSAAGLKERESYGTGSNGMTTPLYLKLHYNKRQQMVDLRLGSVNDEWDLDRGALIFYYGTNGAINQNPFQDDADNNGNLRRQWTYVPKPGGGTVTPQLVDYTYDSLNRVATFMESQINESGTLAPNVATQTFAYDRYGNRQVTSATGGVSNYNPTYDTTNNNNRIVGLGYDAAGNITSDPMTGGMMTYDAENRLLTATNGGGGSYTYDCDGKRVKRITAGQEWWYVYGIGGELLAEYHSAAPTTVKKEYGYRGGQLLVVWDVDKTGDERLKWLVTDHLGSTRMEADKSGRLEDDPATPSVREGIRRHDYAPFGEEMYAGIRQDVGGQGRYGYEPPQSNVRQKFGSKERDNETGLDYFGARYFSSIQGRFTSVDEAPSKLINPQTLNKYRYALNNPLYHIDPDGNQEKKESFVDQLFRIVWERIRWKGEDDNPREKPPETIAPGFPQDMTGEEISGRYFDAFAQGMDAVSHTIMFLDPTGGTSLYYDLQQGNYGGAALGIFLKNARMGRRFQDKIIAATGLPENTDKIVDPIFRTISGSRKPDFLDKMGKVLGEVKGNKLTDVEYRGNLKDFIQYAAKYGYQLNLYIRQGATIQPELRKQLKAIGATVFAYDETKKVLTQITL